MDRVQELKNILIVEDERPLINAVRLALEKAGFGVVVARSASEALDLIADGVLPDAVWLDHYLLGKETGLDLIAKLKTDPATAGVPVFVVSNSGEPNKRHSYLQFGAVKYFIKADTKLQDIIEHIARYLNNPTE